MFLTKLKDTTKRILMLITLSTLSIITMDVDEGTLFSFAGYFIMYYVLFQLSKVIVSKTLRRKL